MFRVERLSKVGTAANIVPSWLILSTLHMEETLSSETSILARSTLRDIPEDGILHGSKFQSMTELEFKRQLR
jgi:hypothetical protein